MLLQRRAHVRGGSSARRHGRDSRRIDRRQADRQRILGRSDRHALPQLAKGRTRPTNFTALVRVADSLRRGARPRRGPPARALAHRHGVADRVCRLLPPQRGTTDRGCGCRRRDERSVRRIGRAGRRACDAATTGRPPLPLFTRDCRPVDRRRLGRRSRRIRYVQHRMGGGKGGSQGWQRVPLECRRVRQAHERLPLFLAAQVRPGQLLNVRERRVFQRDSLWHQVDQVCMQLCAVWLCKLMFNVKVFGVRVARDGGHLVPIGQRCLGTAQVVRQLGGVEPFTTCRLGLSCRRRQDGPLGPLQPLHLPTATRRGLAAVAVVDIIVLRRRRETAR
mmetsp:Transcript_1848/g.5883  ORF Transcript_1848/g.5883 Transcript_1848/m.5883 type:complete len:334 (-) Transcript_1848:1762-2763(-)